MVGCPWTAVGRMRMATHSCALEPAEALPSPAEMGGPPGPRQADHLPPEELMFTFMFGLDWWSGCEPIECR